MADMDKCSTRMAHLSLDKTGITSRMKYLVSLHCEAIKKVKNDIKGITKEPSYEDNSFWNKIIEAKNDELKELEDQLQNYKMIMARTGDDYDLANRESFRFFYRLPALAKRNEIDEFIETFGPENRFLIVQGETGSGKSTQLPQYIADHPKMKGKKVICTQPRKIAAVSLAERVRFEYGCGETKNIGLRVGFSVGGSKAKSSDQTRIEYMTEGRMLELIMNERQEDFARIGAIILDEAHERSMTCDILLGTLKKSFPLWKDVLIVISSATIDLEAFSKFFGYQAKIVKIAGRMYPVQRIYKPLPDGEVIRTELGENGNIIEAVARTALDIHISSKAGDILCFLPGANEIHKAAVLFENHVKSVKNNGQLFPKIYELCGTQEADEQRAVFETLNPNIRKIIFASPIAETSVTIDGVVYVVDSGYKKEMTYDPNRNISALKTVMISQSSSLQREGRAGRTRPGVCYKLYSEKSFDNMSINQLPEILSKPLPLAIIHLRRMGIDPAAFDWISSPLPETIKSAEEELVILGALDGTSRSPTNLGNLISDSQQEPKVVRMIYNGILKNKGKAAIRIAAALSVARFFFYNGGKDADKETKNRLEAQQSKLLSSEGDILTLYKLYNQYESLVVSEDRADQSLKELQSQFLRDNAISGKAIKTAQTIINDLEYIFSRTDLWNQSNHSQESTLDDEEVLKLFCAGFFLHTACRINVKCRRRNRLPYFALVSGVVGSLGYRSSIARTSNKTDEESVGPEWLIYNEIFNYQDMTIFPSSSRIELDWIRLESPVFYNDCLAKQTHFEASVVEIKESETVLREILGRRLINLSLFEKQLHCLLDLDLSSGTLRAFCNSASVDYAELFLKTEVERVRNCIKNEIFEQRWLGNIRLVIENGYKISLVLFSGEYTTICLYALDQNINQEYFEDFIYSRIDDRNKIVRIHLIRLETLAKGEVQFAKCSDADKFLKELRMDRVRVAPCLGDASRAASSGTQEMKLKITWPLAKSKGIAYIILNTPQDGNKAVDCIAKHFPTANVYACGDSKGAMHNGQTTSLKALIEKVLGKLKFCERVTYLCQPSFKVKVSGLLTTLDEFDIINRLKLDSIDPIRVFVERHISNADITKLMFTKPSHIQYKELEEHLVPLKAVLGNETKIDVKTFTDKPAGRMGVNVCCSDPDILQDAHEEARHLYLNMTNFGQPHRVDLEKIHTFSIYADLYECLKPKIQEAVIEMRKLGIYVFGFNPGSNQYHANQRKAKFVNVRYRAHNDEMAWRCRQILDKAMERDSLDTKTSPNIENLFTWTGQAMIRDEVSIINDHYIHRDNQNYQVSVYGVDPIVRKIVIDTLNSIIDRINGWKNAELFESAIFLNRKTLKKIQSKVSNYVNLLCQIFVPESQYQLRGNKLVISMDSKEKFEKFKNCLIKKNLLAAERENNPPPSRDCGVCFCEVTNDYIITSLCNHAFCMDCIRHMFTSTLEGTDITIPLHCPTDNCEQLLPIKDIRKIVPTQALRKLNETALNVYLRTLEGSKYRYCPKPGCNQIFTPTIESGDQASFYSCDNCKNNFCLACTEFFKKEMGAHPGLRCLDIQVNEDDLLRKLVNQVRNEILTLRCPRCKTPFYDYDGCAALSCSSESCKAHFCALCLTDCGSEDAHAHVRKCSYNQTTNLNVRLEIVKEANRLVHIKNLKAFFQDSLILKKSTVSDIKSLLLNALSRDLKDLEIKITDILS